MADEIIPFGKYKGQSVEIIAATDAKYLDWLTLQADIERKFPKLIQAIAALSTGGTSETPEHNSLQALFPVLWRIFRKQFRAAIPCDRHE